MTTPPAEFTRKGFRYTQLEREGDFAIYRQSKIGGSPSNDRYEVVQFQHHPERSIAGRVILATTSYPSTLLWGVCGWTCLDLPSARQKMGDAKRNYEARLAAKQTSPES